MTESFPRALNLKKLLAKNSFFLFGPRGTGKSTLIRKTLKPDFSYDLLQPVEYTRFSASPQLLEQELDTAQAGALVVIDEVQKVPALLDVAHRLIELKRLRFLLTASSSRKLRREGNVNLLAGRAWEARLFPLCFAEIPHFNLTTYLNRGGLPRAFLSDHYREELRAYTAIYLKEEIMAESLVRKLDGFSRFLEVAALQNGEELNFEGIASDAMVKAKTVGNYVEVMEDTLLAYKLPAFFKTKKRKAISRSKLYLFDVGVVNTLAKRGELVSGSELFGKAFEHFIISEVRAYLSYRRLDLNMYYWRSTGQHEVDLIVGDQWAIEIKATSQVNTRHLSGLKALAEEALVQKSLVVSLDARPRRLEGVEILPWKEFLTRLWADELIMGQ